MQPVFPFKLAAVSWGLTSAGMIVAIATHHAGNNAQPPAATSPPTPFVVAVRTIPMFPELAFDDRWRVPAAPQTEPQAATPQADAADQRPVQRRSDPDPEPEPEPRKVRHVHHHHHHAESRGNVCTRHGMHKVITRGGKSWRCRR